MNHSLKMFFAVISHILQMKKTAITAIELAWSKSIVEILRGYSGVEVRWGMTKKIDDRFVAIIRGCKYTPNFRRGGGFELLLEYNGVVAYSSVIMATMRRSYIDKIKEHIAATATGNCKLFRRRCALTLPKNREVNLSLDLEICDPMFDRSTEASPWIKFGVFFPNDVRLLDRQHMKAKSKKRRTTTTSAWISKHQAFQETLDNTDKLEPHNTDKLAFEPLDHTDKPVLEHSTDKHVAFAFEPLEFHLEDTIEPKLVLRPQDPVDFFNDPFEDFQPFKQEFPFKHAPLVPLAQHDDPFDSGRGPLQAFDSNLPAAPLAQHDGPFDSGRGPLQAFDSNLPAAPLAQHDDPFDSGRGPLQAFDLNLPAAQRQHDDPFDSGRGPLQAFDLNLPAAPAISSASFDSGPLLDLNLVLPASPAISSLFFDDENESPVESSKRRKLSSWTSSPDTTFMLPSWGSDDFVL
jgi:hypothetical protein